MKLSINHILINVLVWTGVALFDLAGDYFNALLWDREFYWRDEIPFVTSWYTWALLTPLALFFGKRFPYSNTQLGPFIAYHFGIYLVLNTIQILLATIHIWVLNRWLSDAQPFSGVLYKIAMSGTFYNALIYALLLLAINTIRYYKDLQLEQTRSVQLEKKLTESRMQFLKQQLQPHFLFNTHHSIITLMKLGEKSKAVEMMERLSELMRFALRDDQAQEITLEKELYLTDLYLGIQKVRFEDKLQVHYDIEDIVRNAVLPAMILQPLIENAVKYAVEPATESCAIIISAKKSEAFLYLSIQDNGLSFSPGVLHKGIGLGNTEERLEKLYGKAHFFEIKQGKGFHVNIKIPLRYV
jgi:sensor histidine kinase YesM